MWIRMEPIGRRRDTEKLVFRARKQRRIVWKPLAKTADVLKQKQRKEDSGKKRIEKLKICMEISGGICIAPLAVHSSSLSMLPDSAQM